MSTISPPSEPQPSAGSSEGAHHQSELEKEVVREAQAGAIQIYLTWLRDLDPKYAEMSRVEYERQTQTIIDTDEATGFTIAVAGENVAEDVRFELLGVGFDEGVKGTTILVRDLDTDTEADRSPVTMPIAALEGPIIVDYFDQTDIAPHAFE